MASCESRMARNDDIGVPFRSWCVATSRTLDTVNVVRPLLPALLAGLCVVSALPVRASEKVGLIRIDGAIGPATAGYVSRAIEVAGKVDYECLVVELDTPGGLLDSTKQIVQSIYAASLPVVVYVTPSGASAASAGCFITLSADVAAMAPNTNIGAAHPVSIGGFGGSGDEGKSDDTMAKKIENYSISYIEAIATKRGRNVEWAASSVRESASITAEKALKLHVIDLVAKDVSELLRQIDGRSAHGRTLATADAEVVEIPMVMRERVFQVLWRPEVMFLLMLVAVYGIIGELSNPGAILPGVAGVIALILALYMASILPVNVTGLALIGLAIALFVGDIFAPTHGVLTTGGIVSFFLGSMMAFDSVVPAFQLSLRMIIPATIITALFFIFVVGKGIRAQSLPVKAGRETLVGRVAPAITKIEPGAAGRVFVEGEDWRASSETPIARGEPVKIVAVRGLTLIVKSAKATKPL